MYFRHFWFKGTVCDVICFRLCGENPRVKNDDSKVRMDGWMDVPDHKVKIPSLPPLALAVNEYDYSE